MFSRRQWIAPRTSRRARELEKDVAHETAQREGIQRESQRASEDLAAQIDVVGERLKSEILRLQEANGWLES